MKPFRAFLFLSSVLCLLFLVALYQSKSNQEQLHRPVLQIPIEGSRFEPDTIQRPIYQPGPMDPDSLPPPFDKRFTESERIEIPEAENLIFANDDSVRFSSIAEKLFASDTLNHPVRILYYGDSQIENDHITSALRESLQKRYGGRGPGLIAPELYYNPPHQLFMTLSENWQKQSLETMEGRNKSIILKSALAAGSNENFWFRINRLRFLSPREDYNQIRFFIYCSDTSYVELFRSGNSIFNDQIDSIHQILDFSIPLLKTPGDLKISFTTKDSLWVEALSLESKSGIFVDNIALRGVPYPPFSESDQEALNLMTQKLSPDLFILQFGVNVVPYPAKNYHIFRSRFDHQIKVIRQLCPRVPILIVGVSDMAHRLEGEFVSYENIDQIKQIQFEVAMENHCAFWDLEKFMGGPGSMINWVNANPTLGRTDYIHFTEKGADKIGHELARIFISEFETSQLAAWNTN